MESDKLSITKEDIKEWVDQLNAAGIPQIEPGKIGLLDKLEIEDLKTILGSYPISEWGEMVYRLPFGALTNKAGWDLFNEALKNSIDGK